MVIWLIGLSGSGKTTLGRELATQWQKKAPNTVLLDGDNIRQLFSHDQTPNHYSIEGRKINAERMTALCELLDKQNINVICCMLSIFEEMRQENKKRFGQYYEIFMDAPLSVLQQRDTKGLYAKAASGALTNVVGIDIPFQRPSTSDLIIDTSGPMMDIPTLASQTLNKLGVI